MFSSCIFHLKKAHHGCVNGSNLTDPFTETQLSPILHGDCLARKSGQAVHQQTPHSCGQAQNKANLEQVASQKAKWGILRDLNEDDLHGSRGEPQLVKQGGVGRHRKTRKQGFIHCTPLTTISFNYWFISILFLWLTVDQRCNCTRHRSLLVSAYVCTYRHTHTHMYNTWPTKQAAWDLLLQMPHSG